MVKKKKKRIWNFIQFPIDRVQPEHCSSPHCQEHLLTPCKCKEMRSRGKKESLIVIIIIIIIIITIHNISFKKPNIVPNTPTFFLSILQSSFCGILLEEGLKRTGLQPSPTRHLTHSAYCTIPILGFLKPKNYIRPSSGLYTECARTSIFLFSKNPMMMKVMCGLALLA